MPQDLRRIQVPEDSMPYQLLSKNCPNQVKDSRPDGRKPENMRSIYLKAGVVTQAKGSSYIELNNTKVICAVYGPREVSKKSNFNMNGQLSCSFKYAPFACKYRRQHVSDAEEKELSDALRDAFKPAVMLHQFPKSQIDIYCTVLEDDGSVLAAALTCSSVALVDAGINLYDIVIGSSLRIADTFLQDPCKEEEYDQNSDEGDTNCSHGNLTLAYMPNLGQVVTVFQEGVMDVETVSKGVHQLINNCKCVKPAVQSCVMDKITQELHNMH